MDEKQENAARHILMGKKELPDVDLSHPKQNATVGGFPFEWRNTNVWEYNPADLNTGEVGLFLIYDQYKRKFDLAYKYSLEADWEEGDASELNRVASAFTRLATAHSKLSRMDALLIAEALFEGV